MLRFHLITLFPDSIQAYACSSILKKAQEKGLIEINFYNPMDYCVARTKGALVQRVDDKPYAGGPGMVVRVEPVMKAIQQAIGRKKNVGFIHFKPRAEHFTTAMAQTMAQESLASRGAVKDLVIICGRYEGIDSRIEEMFPGRTISVGDYVLTGGELPAMIVVDCVSRQIPGVLGEQDSLEEGREAAGLYYTRPESITFRGKEFRVPQVLLEGNHAKIQQWRRENQ